MNRNTRLKVYVVSLVVVGVVMTALFALADAMK